MTTGVDPTSPAPAGAEATAAGPGVLVLATAAAQGGGPAAALAWEEGTLLGRMLDQLEAAGAGAARVLTRPAFADAVRAAAGTREVALELSDDAQGDARTVAAAVPAGELLILAAEVVLADELVAALVNDPPRTAILTGDPGGDGGRAPGVRDERGRAVSVGSSHHVVHQPNLRFLSVLRVPADQRPALAAAAAELAGLLGGWDDEQPDDVAALLAVGLVRAGVHVHSARLRGHVWARPRTPAEVADAGSRLAAVDPERVRLDATVKASDGFFTTFFVSPYSKYVARWAAHRGSTPNQVTTLSLGIGVLAAGAMATGERWGLVAGAVLLQVAFIADCVDGQLARYTRSFSRFGAWLDSVFDRAKEYLVYAGLAIGAERAGDPVWALAGAALALQTARHMSDFSYATAEEGLIEHVRQPPLGQREDAAAQRARERGAGGAGPARRAARSPVSAILALWRRMDRGSAIWLKKLLAFPIGERFAVISLTTALWTPRTAFTVLLAWGVTATVYQHIGRLLRTVER